MTSATTDILTRLERYYDAVPRSIARAEDFGPLTLFVRDGSGYPYYARPTLGWTGAPATADDVERVRARQRELDVPEAFEWVPETTPGLGGALEETGLALRERPLMLLEDDGLAAPPHPLVRLLAAEDPALPGALAVPHLAFADLGTAVGTAGPDELAAMIATLEADDGGSVERVAERILAGRSVVAAAVEDGVVLCAGQYLPVDTATEIVGVGTLPSARRRGLAVAVTAALAADARSRGIETVFLTATDDAVARIYARVGFRRIGTAMEAAAE
ncbi:GNAT family N-acetyltransferase [Streptomyces sp. ISL-100]|uniref:GNAT family N-acetyltransferase n=1 Tax=Streptomyces sp. ISL-100 TaxID=2819173 RepID=UPI001BEBBB69|nr:GNAT family N-acetyltransferase [Streptomyces sp. ISL-100]MBT2400971.1 GNAT family N-acetyltransferase [Streptomyces sp. ISL-100]